jgi:hypothetical protein
VIPDFKTNGFNRVKKKTETQTRPQCENFSFKFSIKNIQPISLRLPLSFCEGQQASDFSYIP